MKRSLLFSLETLALVMLACGLSPAATATQPIVQTEVVVAPYESPTVTLTSQPASTASSPPAVPVIAQVSDQVNLRAGPGLDTAVVGLLNAGDSVPVIGRAYDVPWYLVSWPAAPGGQAWVYKDVVTLSGDLYSVPLVTITQGSTVVVATDAPTATQPPVASGPGPSPTPFGCQTPTDDYTIVRVGQDMVINRRTYTMLVHAQELYGSRHDFLKAITQGSYSPGVDASFGTHDGGGAVDISVRDLSTYAVLTDQLPAIILALREAGFAAWVREPDELGPGSPIHIHMIAVGDKDLSPAARRQIDGIEGYFRGFNGLPVDPPAADKWGPPILCPWMVELGYSDLRTTP